VGCALWPHLRHVFHVFEIVLCFQKHVTLALGMNSAEVPKQAQGYDLRSWADDEHSFVPTGGIASDRGRV
jgi:hypothetical protein